MFRNKKQQAIADELSSRLIECLKADISELENNGKYAQAAKELNVQVLAKRYVDFSILYSWAISLSCGMYYVVSEKSLICEAAFENIRNFLETCDSGEVDLAEYIKDTEEFGYFSRNFAKNKISRVTLGLLWLEITEKRFFDYNNVYSGSAKFFPVAVKFYRHIFGKDPTNDFNSSVLVSLFAGFLSKVFAIRVDDPTQEEISKYSKMIEINPGYAKAYYNRAVAYFAKQEYDKSWQDVCKAKELGCEIDPEFLESLKKVLGKE